MDFRDSLISVIIPCYNAEKYLATALDSLLNQTYKIFEAIIINDGSNDKSEEIAEKYCAKDKRFILVNQNNKGLSAARNTGIAKSKGKIITFLDADDYYHKDFLKESLIFHTENSSTEAAAFGRFIYINPEGDQLQPYTLGVPRILGLADFHECPFPPVTVSIKRKALASLSYIFNENIRVAEDVELWIRLAETGISFHPIFSALSAYRLHSESIMFNEIEKYLENSIQILQRLLTDRQTELQWHNSFCKRAIAFAVQAMVYQNNPKSELIRKYNTADVDITPSELADICALAFTRATLKPWEVWVNKLDFYKDKFIKLFQEAGFSNACIQASFEELKNYEGAFIGKLHKKVCKNWNEKLTKTGRLAIFGAGRNALRLLISLRQDEAIQDGMEIFFIDECASLEKLLSYKVYSPKDPYVNNADCIVLSSPNHIKVNIEKCKQLFGEDYCIINLFD